MYERESAVIHRECIELRIIDHARMSESWVNSMYRVDMDAPVM